MEPSEEVQEKYLETFMAVRAILLEHWDPIGIKTEPNAQDEYDSYIPKMLYLAAQGGSADDLAVYLEGVEFEAMNHPKLDEKYERCIKSGEAVHEYFRKQKELNLRHVIWQQKAEEQEVKSAKGSPASVFEELHGAKYEAVSGIDQNSELGIERGPCSQESPVYHFVMKSDGSFRYRGIDHVEPVGVVIGKVESLETYLGTINAIQGRKFFELEDEYVTDASIFHFPTDYSYLAMGGRRKVIKHFAHSGPLYLSEIETLLENLMRETLKEHESSRIKK